MELSFSAVKVRSTTETSGVGTPREHRQALAHAILICLAKARKAMPVNLPLVAGKTSPTAFAAPVALACASGRIHPFRSFYPVSLLPGDRRDDVAAGCTATAPVLQTLLNSRLPVTPSVSTCRAPSQTLHPQSSGWQCRHGWWSSGPSQFRCPPGKTSQTHRCYAAQNASADQAR